METIQANGRVARSDLGCFTAEGDKADMLQINFAKEFHRVSHSGLFDILPHVRCGTIMLTRVRMVCTNCSSRLMINSTITEDVLTLPSVSNCFPLSPLSFVLYLEPYCLRIAHDIEVCGYFYSADCKTVAYADDVTLFCAHRGSVFRVSVLTD